ncbi:MAG: sugar nucleotide-binding protein [Hyphomicrobiaceae bacterium]|nr:sugar nucleotide-binding protein [Hyphomicrobiaceae bacterium]
MGRPKLDLTNHASISKVFEIFTPNAVVNTAALTAVDKAENDVAAARALNTSGTGEVAGGMYN